MRKDRLFLTGLALLCLAVTSCSKEQKAASIDEIEKAGAKSDVVSPMACMFDMVAFYASNNGLTDTSFSNGYISNGIAHMGSSPYSSPYWSAIKTWRPQIQQDYCFILGEEIGDTLTFNVRLKNPSSGFGAVSAWDVGISMIGTQGTAGVSFVGNTTNQQYTYLRAGSTSITNNASLVHEFNVWTELKLVAVQIPNSNTHTLSIYRDNTLLLSLNYDRITSGIGKVKEFDIAFKGAGSVDWMRVSSSNTGNLRLTNEFEPMDEYDNGLWWHYD